jgi:hypothetical protein
MSKIEADAKPILSHLIRARGRRLPDGKQRKLATWALLKACVFDELHPNERAVPTEHRQYLFENSTPPADGVWVRLATYEARDIGHYAYQGMKLVPEGDPEPSEPTVYFVTITIGALVVQITGSMLSDWTFASVPYPPELNVAEIWPPTPTVEFVQSNLMVHSTLVGYTKLLYNVVGKLTGGAPPPR